MKEYSVYDFLIELTDDEIEKKILELLKLNLTKKEIIDRLLVDTGETKIDKN